MSERRASISALSVLKCIACGHEHQIDEPVYLCGRCGGLLDVVHDLERLRPLLSRETFDARLREVTPPYNSGVWRFKELVFPGVADEQIVTRGEGNTTLYRAPAKLAARHDLLIRHAG
ncbi:MAG: threonine synthase, partial [Chloroflexi bacterium]|nr:threonine synthase [Chloroflexota bacterium]